MIILTILNIIMLLSGSVLSDDLDRATIHGKVVDARTRQPLPWANIVIEHSTIGTASNKEGLYEILNAPAGQFHLVATMIGYKSQHKSVSVGRDQTITV